MRWWCGSGFELLVVVVVGNGDGDDDDGGDDSNVGDCGGDDYGTGGKYCVISMFIRVEIIHSM